MRSLFIFLLVLSGSTIFGQKPCIDSTVYGNWPYPSPPVISNNGKYAFYAINHPGGNTIHIIQAIDNSWKLELSGTDNLQFTGNSKMVICKLGQDSLCMINLITLERTYISNVSSFKLTTQNPDGYLAIRLNNSKRELLLKNLTTQQETYFPAVTNYLFNDDNTALLLQQRLPGDSAILLQWVDLATNKITPIWKGSTITNITSMNRTNLAFVGDTLGNIGSGKLVWYYQVGSTHLTKLLDDSSAQTEYGLSINKIVGFNKDGSKLFISLIKEKSSDKTNHDPNKASVDVWSYLDTKLQSQQLYELDHPVPSTFRFVINISNLKIVRLEKDESEKVISPFGLKSLKQQQQNFVLVQRCEEENSAEFGWNNSTLNSVYLVSTTDGSRRTICENKPMFFTLNNYSFSPEGNYIIYYDAVTKNYFSYTIASGITRNITRLINTTWSSFHTDDIASSPFITMGIAGWLKDDSAVLIYDQHDIWQVDPKGLSKPLNLTNAYGQKHNIHFRLAFIDPNMPFSPKENILLSAFNRNTKEDGFYKIAPGQQINPFLLTMQPYLIEGSSEMESGPGVQLPIKARDAEVYIVHRESAEEAPNYFVTTDLKHFLPLTTIHPEKAYNWVHTELITWKLPDGKTSQGILYKPENFNAQRKYPIIFYYYEKLSEGLHAFIRPDYNDGVIDIPTYVSNGYLVFTPDIHFEIGHPGRSVVNTLVSAATYLSQLSFVDGKHMGIQGHSRGGWETNYLVTHTHLFAAAMSGSGMSDFVSLTGATRTFGNGTSRTSSFETSFQRIGASFGKRPDLYIENSPIFSVNEVTTPLLLMSNKKDADIPFEQGLEFFIALRRAGKKVWLLQYDNSGHTTYGNITASKDLTIRVQQFFDHYLKNTAAPVWMVTGIPAKLKGIEQGYRLEPKGVEPGLGTTYSPSLLEPVLKKPTM